MRDDNGPKIGWLPKHGVKKQSSPTWKLIWEIKISKNLAFKSKLGPENFRKREGVG